MAKKTYLIVTVYEYDLIFVYLNKKYLISHKQGKIPTSTNLLEQMYQDGFGIDFSYFNKFSSKDLNDLHAQLPENFSIEINEIEKVKGI